MYSDDEVDCNDDGRSLDRPHQPRIFAPPEVRQDASNQSTESQQPGKCEVVSQSKVDDGVSTAEYADRKEVDDGKNTTSFSSNSSVAQDPRLSAANVDDRSRFSQRPRLSAEEWPGQVSSREERSEHISHSGRKIRSPDGGNDRGRSSLNERRSRRDVNIVAGDRGDSSHYRTASERHVQHQTTRSCGRRNRVSRSRSRSRDYSRSRSPCRQNRVDAEWGVRSRTNEHRAAARTEPEERQRRWSRHDVNSVSGRRSERHVSSRARPEVETTRCWREDRGRVVHGVEASTVPNVPSVPTVPIVPRGGQRPRRDPRYIAYEWCNRLCLNFILLFCYNYSLYFTRNHGSKKGIEL